LISIQSGMLVALGFLIASLLALLLASAFWSRAVRLTTKRLKESLPVSEAEIRADLDRLRATYAIKVHKLETQLDQAKHARARHLIEINRRDASVSALETDVVAIRAELDENVNARRVLEQTVADRLPKVEARLAEAKRLLFNRDREIAELAQGARRHKAALEEAASINAQRTAEIERLTNALITKGGRKRRSGADGEDEPEGEVALRAEAEALRTKTREQALLIDRLQRRLGEGYFITAAATGPTTQPVVLAQGENPAHSPVDRLRESLAEAEQTLLAARAGTVAEPTPVEREKERELRALRARIDDQAGEIARLKAGLATFEQADQAETGLRNSRLALKARAGSAEAQAERQAATISKLRAELASANERLAQQATHFTEEMRRLGSGTAPASGQARRPGRDSQRRRLAERVADVPSTSITTPVTAAPQSARAADTAEAGVQKPAGNGKGAEIAPPPGAQPMLSSQQAPSSPAQPATQAAPPDAPRNGPKGAPADPPPPAAPAAAEMPQTAAIPEARRRLRLLDRITGLGKA
jgi:hypothetical protein